MALLVSNVGDEGFEPPHARTKTWCLTAWLIPNVFNQYPRYKKQKLNNFQ